MLVIEEEALLNALLKSLCMAKFGCPAEDVAELAGSPLVAEVLNRAYDALVCAYRRNNKGGYADRLEQQRDVQQQDRVIAAAYAHVLIARAYWATCAGEQKRQFVQILISPYTASNEAMDAIIGHADSLMDTE